MLDQKCLCEIISNSILDRQIYFATSFLHIPIGREQTIIVVQHSTFWDAWQRWEYNMGKSEWYCVPLWQDTCRAGKNDIPGHHGSVGWDTRGRRYAGIP